jgi:hypothetical protein
VYRQLGKKPVDVSVYFEKFTLVLSEKKIASSQYVESLHAPY